MNLTVFCSFGALYVKLVATERGVWIGHERPTTCGIARLGAQAITLVAAWQLSCTLLRTQNCIGILRALCLYPVPTRPQFGHL